MRPPSRPSAGGEPADGDGIETKQGLQPSTSSSSELQDGVLIAEVITLDQLEGPPYFPASDKKKDSRYKWFVGNYGH